MINFWLNFAFLAASWGLAIWMDGGPSVANTLVSSVFFTCYFLLPLFQRKLAQIVLLFLPILTTVLFFNASFNAFIWLLFLALIMQATRYFEQKGLQLYVIFLFILTIIPYVYAQQWISVAYSVLLCLITLTVLYSSYSFIERKKALEVEYEELKTEYGALKRQLVHSEEAVRQEERNQIAREIHDSVGHRLTALLMQIEAARLQADNEGLKSKFAELKKIAQASLAETREAVKTLKSEETSGIQAVIQLVRKLELESRLRLSITMQTGVLGTVLSNQQSIVVYRSIQEALTNMMRHSASRQAEIEFQIIAQRDLRFRIAHPLKEAVKINEGFGLKAMRERLTEVQGRLTIRQIDGQFEIIGQFPIEGEKND